MRLLSGLLLVAAGCFGPFHRGPYDNRPPDAVVIAKVLDDGRIALDDGRTVRLFGVREAPVAYLRDHEGKKASVEVLLPTVPPAVELRVWERGIPRVCGNGLMTWNLFAAPDPAYFGHPVVADLFGRFAPPPRESDLDHPDAPEHLVRAIRAATAP
ncbi:MAG: hypothetical protein ACYTEZ_13980 [Planctomycetota bacterium]|jgi:hypothetical protein